MSEYQVELEVAGPLAMFARPDTGGTPTSYPVPTWSACKGISESIALLADGAGWINPARVEICRRVGESGGVVRFQRYTTNYGGPLRKKSLLNKGTAAGGSSMQLFATVLSDVCYRLHASVEGPRLPSHVNTRHYLKALFDRRLKQGRCHHTPCLGWNEFTCSYWGPFRKEVTERDDALSLEIPSMLVGVWTRPVLGQYAPTFQQNVEVKAGLLEYEIPASWCTKAESEGVTDAQ